MLGALVLAVTTTPAQMPAAPASPGGMVPVTEKVLARHEGFELSVALKTVDGDRFRQGFYDVSVIQAGDQYFLQLIHRTTRRGIRIPATFRGRIDARIATSDETRMWIRTEPTRSVFTFETDTFTVESVLGYG